MLNLCVVLLMKSIFIYLLLIVGVFNVFCSCTDDDDFSTSTSDLLTFSMDTVRLDTVFSTVTSSTRSFWIHNNSGRSIRCTNVRLENGNQSGFRVNVSAASLGPSNGYQVGNIEVRKGDSARVFVKITSPKGNRTEPKHITDNIVFMLESGVQQKVNLDAFSWDAVFLKNLVVSNDTTIASGQPIVVYGKMVVGKDATLTITPGTTMYFHADAGIDVEGRLLCKGTAEKGIVLRGDRLDNMFDYLPYDYVSGQWQGVRIKEGSYGNVVSFTDLHGSFDGLRVDSSDVSREKLDISNTTIHNCQGTALYVENSKVNIANCQLSNSLGSCLHVDGGDVRVNNCTLAQFYPFDSSRGSALRFSGIDHPLKSFVCTNTLVTGYSADELTGEKPSGDNPNEFNFDFSHCVLRTPPVETDDREDDVDVAIYIPQDTTAAGTKNFVKIDTEKLRYDFHLQSTSAAVDKADPTTSAPADREGFLRDGKPDIGAYEYREEEKPKEE